MRKSGAVIAAAIALIGGQAHAASVENGRRIVQRNCAVCHAVGPRGESPNKLSPPFRDLHTRYPVEMLAEALAEGILTGHPAMPQFTFPARDIEDIIVYLQSIQTQGTGSLPVPAHPAG